MKALLFASLLAASGTCGPTPSPPPAPPSLSPAAIYSELVDGHCYAPSEGGVAVVTQESQLKPPPLWYECLQEGGTIAACGVPCSPPGSP